jgi:3-hydroxybutyryl-CoA dehydrogenase
MKAEDIKRVLIGGTGTMGRHIGSACAMNGFAVVLYDIKEDIVEKARESIRKRIDSIAARGEIPKETASEAKNNIRATTDLAAAGCDVDLVIESIPEDPNIKGEFFAKLNAVCPSRTIFTTNSSSLVPSLFAHKTGRPDRFCAFHFHPASKLVDVMPHPGTAPETLETVRGFSELINHSPIVLKRENPGYVFNALLNPWLLAALNLVAGDVVSPEEVDRAWKVVTYSPVGPFAMMDIIGLETVWHITDYWAKKKNDPRAQKSADLLKQYVDRGDLGITTGKGFYEYSSRG